MTSKTSAMERKIRKNKQEMKSKLVQKAYKEILYSDLFLECSRWQRGKECDISRLTGFTATTIVQENGMYLITKNDQKLLPKWQCLIYVFIFKFVV